jgi:hypothetical protein
MFVSGKTFHPSLVFVGEARAYPRVEHMKGTSLGALPSNTGLGWTCLPETNTLAYYEYQ